jgi:hypothetical protein
MKRVATGAALPPRTPFTSFCALPNQDSNGGSLCIALFRGLIQRLPPQNSGTSSYIFFAKLSHQSTYSPPPGIRISPANRAVAILIGWIHLFQGRWSIEWNASYRAWRTQLPPDDPLRQASTFAVKAGRLLLRYWLTLWKFQNEQRQTEHDPDFVTAHEDQIRNCLRPRMRPYDTRIIYPSIEAHLTDDIPEIESWIITNQALIAHSVDKASRLCRERQGLITTHFDVPTPPGFPPG